MRGLRRASWSDGGGCGGAAGFSFGERSGSNGGSVGRWLLSRSEDGRLPASCCLVGGDGPRRGGGRLFRGGTARTEVPAGQCLLSRSEDGRLPVSCCLVGGDGPRRGGEPLFRGEAGSDTSPIASAIRCYHPPPATTRRPLPPPPLLVTPVAVCLPAACRLSLPVIISSSAVACTSAASHPPHQLPASPPPVSPPPVSPPPVSPPPATSATAACYPCRCLPPRCLSLFPACYHPSPVITLRLPPATASHQPHPLPAISAAMRRPGGRMGCGGTPRGRSGRDAPPARSSAK